MCQHEQGITSQRRRWVVAADHDSTLEQESSRQEQLWPDTNHRTSGKQLTGWSSCGEGHGCASHGQWSS